MNKVFLKKYCTKYKKNRLKMVRLVKNNYVQHVGPFIEKSFLSM